MSRRKDAARTGSQQLIKEINQVLIFRAIRERGPISRSQLAKELRLSPTTVTVIIDYFMENGFLIETGKGDSSGGRKPILVKLAPNAGVVIAVDLEQNRVAVLNMEADILQEKKLVIFDNKELLTSLIAVINELIAEYRDRHKMRPLGIGIAVPGIIDLQKGTVFTASKLNFNHLSLKEELQEHFQVPVLLENDANAAAYGEFLYGRAQQVPNFLYLHIGRAVGAGFFLSGNLFTGGAGGAGEFGHISVDESGPLCHCGNIGCLEKLISEHSLLEKWREWAGAEEATGIPALAEMVELSNNGGGTAGRLMDYAGEMLGKGVVTLVHLFNPTLILLGGELALNNLRLLDQVKKQVDRRSMPVFLKHVKIEESLTKLNAGIIGAGSLALHHFFENLHIDAVTNR
ncbi:ROK family transcriptional regulator [Paenibacillus foliorum]|uniref:ROK family transcriptional regulator n=1 Tax=Paenibacillus foliorum TaxID=2654974 RepID=UPI0014914CC8|nr:ROK family transcriptional regulator [Paenibacillus foliorum]